MVQDGKGKQREDAAGNTMELKGKQREMSPDHAPSRSQSPVAGASSGSAGNGRKQEMSERRRRDHVSVGSRMSRTIVVRPPYAARDELDFERRPRSNTVGTANDSENSKSPKGVGSSTSGRHPGIQPALHANPTANNDDQMRSQLSSSSTTFVNNTSDQNHQQQNGQDGPGQTDSGNGLPQRPSQSHNAAERPTTMPRVPSNDASRWLAFTLPVKYRKRLDDYRAGRTPMNEHAEDRRGSANASSSEDSNAESSADEYHQNYFGRYKRRRRDSQSRQNSGDFTEGDGQGPEQQRKHRSRKKDRSRRGGQREGSPEGLAMSTRARERDNMPISINQAQTPGWNSPWEPHAPQHGQNLPRSPGAVGIHRFTSANEGHDLDHPGTSSDKKKKQRSRADRYQRWLIGSAFAPLLFRLLNLSFTACILAIAINLRIIMLKHDVLGIMGSSTTFAIVVGPLSLVHAFVNVYAEYFGSPIGVWKVRSKMFYTFTELIFICLWSGLLSLAFDNLFTSAAGCTSYTPNGRYGNVDIGNAAANGSIADQLCDNQTALVALVFVGTILYLFVLIVSLFRIFAKINRYT